jgi:type VI protein secretion system component Hcp
MRGKRATAGATLEAIMSKQKSNQSKPIELGELELGSVVGGTKTTDGASPNLFLKCCNGKHIDNAKLH